MGFPRLSSDATGGIFQKKTRVIHSGNPPSDNRRPHLVSTPTAQDNYYYRPNQAKSQPLLPHQGYPKQLPQSYSQLSVPGSYQLSQAHHPYPPLPRRGSTPVYERERLHEHEPTSWGSQSRQRMRPVLMLHPPRQGSPATPSSPLNQLMLLVFSLAQSPLRRPSMWSRNLAPLIRTRETNLPLPTEQIFNNNEPAKKGGLLRRISHKEPRVKRAPKTRMEWAGLPPPGLLPPRTVSSKVNADDDLPLCGWDQ